MPTHIVGQFLRGVTYPVLAVLFLQRHPRLWRSAVLPVVINVLLLLTLAFWGWFAVWPWLQRLGAYFETMAADGDVVRGLISALMLVLWFLVFPVVVCFAGAVMLLVGQGIASPFLEMLSERVEAIASGAEVPAVSWRRWRRILAVAVVDTVGGLLYLIATATPLFLLSFIPVVGTLASLAVGAMLVAQQFVGLPLARQLVSYGDRWRVVIRQRWFCLGFGSATVAMLALPGLNLLLLPLATVGGTLLFCDLKKAALVDVQQGRVYAP